MIIHQSTNRLFNRSKRSQRTIVFIFCSYCSKVPQIGRLKETNESSHSSRGQKPEIPGSAAMFALKVADESFLDSSWLLVAFWPSLVFCRLQMGHSNLLPSHLTLPVHLHIILPTCVSISMSKFPLFIKTLPVILHQSSP